MFKEYIWYYIKKEWYPQTGLCGIIYENDFRIIQILDAFQITCKENPEISDSIETRKDYACYLIGKYLKNEMSKNRIINDYWMNQYFDKAEILRMFKEAEFSVKQIKEEWHYGKT